MGKIDDRLAEIGVEIPEAAAPVANYVGYVQSGNMVFVSGQVTIENGEFKYVGKVGEDFTVEEGAEAARLCGINIIAQVKAACGGDLDRVVRVVKLGGFVNAPVTFTDHPKVINGCSDLFVEVFGDAGRHARSAVGMGSLPSQIPVEIECIIEIGD